MLRRIALAISIFLAPLAAFAASGPVSGFTSASSVTSSTLFYCAIANTSSLKCTPAQIAAYNYSLMSGDCTASGTGAITCTKTNGTAFSGLATLAGSTAGDLAYYNGSSWARFAGNTGSTAFLSESASGVPSWSGGAGVTSLSWTCPTTNTQTGAVTFGNGVTEVPESTGFTPLASQCGALFTSTGGAGATLPTIGVAGGDVESPYFVVIKNADTAGNSMTVGGGGTNINYNGSSSSSITLSAGQSTLIAVNAANNLWQATSTATGSIPVWHPGYISGDWYNLNTAPNVATGSGQTASTVYCALQQTNITVTIKSLGAYFSTGVASGNVSYAMFRASAGRPSTMIDYAGPVAAPTAAGASTASLHNTTDTLAPGVYIFCETQDNSTGIINSIYNASGAVGATWIGASAPLSAGAAQMSNIGISCTAASTCGTGFAAWVAGAFTWASFTNPTWTTTGLSTPVPLIEVQVN